MQVHFPLIAALVPGHECEGACAGSRVHDAWVGAAWDVSCILALTWVHYRTLQCLGQDGHFDLDLLCACAQAPTHVHVTGLGWTHRHNALSPCLFLTQKGEPRPNLPVPLTLQHISQPSGQGPRRLPLHTHTHISRQSYRSGGSWQERRKGESKGRFPNTCEGSSLYMQMSSLEMQSTSRS